MLDSVSIRIEASNTGEIDVLVMQKRPLGFNLLLWIDVIKVLGGVCITHTGDVNFKGRPSICPAV